MRSARGRRGGPWRVDSFALCMLGRTSMPTGNGAREARRNRCPHACERWRIETSSVSSVAREVYSVPTEYAQTQHPCGFAADRALCPQCPQSKTSMSLREGLAWRKTARVLPVTPTRGSFEPRPRGVRCAAQGGCTVSIPCGSMPPNSSLVPPFHAPNAPGFRHTSADGCGRLIGTL
jgi:hypothetical protein